MFSSLTSYLPSALHIGQDHHEETPAAAESTAEHNGVKAVDHAPRPNGKKRKEKLANETFIFVRPPPAKSNHPLNLQVQLVPPNSRAPGGLVTPRHSIDGEQDLTLSRTSSNRSNTSAYSAATSESCRSESTNASTSSFSSVASSSSGRRMIIPLYNLQAHNVLANAIVDAGTDAKIAKFHKRGLELIDLAVLEPLEVWAINGQAAKPAILMSQQQTKGGSTTRPVTPDPSTPHASQGFPPGVSTPGSSHLSLSSAGIGSEAVNHSQTPQTTSELEGAVSPRRRNIFGKLFKNDKKKDSASTLVPDAEQGSRHSRNGSASFLSPNSQSLASFAAFGKPQARRSASPNPSHDRRASSSKRSSLMMELTTDNTVDGLPSDSGNPSEFGAFTTPMPSAIGSVTPSQTPSNSQFLNAQPAGMPTLLPATLGIQPTLSSLLPFPFPLPPSTPYPPNLVHAVQKLHASGFTIEALPTPVGTGLPRGPAMYVWIVRRWLKNDGGSLFSNLAGMMRSTSTGNGEARRGSAFGGGQGLESRVEVRVEWKRGRDKDKDKEDKEKLKKKAGSIEQPTTPSRNSSRRSSKIFNPSQTSLANSTDVDATPTAIKRTKTRNRLSLISNISASLSDVGDNPSVKPEDDDEDPEDSETPWVCTVKVRKVDKEKEKDGERDAGVKLKVGILSPTPHHPKVVAMLKVPYPLPDVDVAPNVGLVPRNGADSQSQRQSGQQAIGKMDLTAEEIKDVICSTGLWLVVREGFGGMGKVGRKGDGWRIRA